MKIHLHLGVHKAQPAEDAGSASAESGEKASAPVGLSRSSFDKKKEFEVCPKENFLKGVGSSYFEVAKLLPAPSSESEDVHSAVNGGACRTLLLTNGQQQNAQYCEVSDVDFSGFMAGVAGAGPKTTASTVAMKLTGYEDKNMAGSIYGAENATVEGSIYLEVATSGATPGKISGTLHADVSGEVEVLLDDKEATYLSPVVAGDRAPDSSSIIRDGTKLKIVGGTFERPVIAGGLGGIIEGGSMLCIDGGLFKSKVMAGSYYGSTIRGVANGTPAVSLLVNKGTFHGEVSAAGWDNNIEGDVNVFVEDGLFNKTLSGGKINNLVSGDVLMVIGGGTFKGDVIAGATALRHCERHQLRDHQPRLAHA